MAFNVCVVANYPRSLPSLSSTKKLSSKKQQRQYKINVARAIGIIIRA